MVMLPMEVGRSFHHATAGYLSEHTTGKCCKLSFASEKAMVESAVVVLFFSFNVLPFGDGEKVV